jgi:hypothetical protein
MERPLFSRLEHLPGVYLDSRRAVWFSEAKTLVVSDTHFGHAWVDRVRGHLSPISAGETGLQQLAALLESYHPNRLIIAGDVVHATSAVKALEAILLELDGMCRRAGTQLMLVLGNHDRGLTALISRLGVRAELERELSLGRFRFVHGDVALVQQCATEFPGAEGSVPEPSCLFFGHEHPSVTLRGAGQRSARCPCFLVGPGIVALPAFSSWAAGCDVGSGRFMGPIATEARFESAVVCVGPRLLKLPWPIPASA